MFRSIDTGDFQELSKAEDFGPVPSLHWLEIAELVVDDEYQREIGRRGRQNIRSIVAGFEWSKFAPVIVASIEGGKYAIVDGQHRTTAAAILGFSKVPCQVILADRKKQAEAFAAVNGAITKTTPTQLYHAKVSAGDPLTAEVKDACKVAGVFISKDHHRTCRQYVVGETQAIGAITRAYQRYGRETLITGLMCITQTGDGNPGFVRSTIIEAICSVLNQRRDWRDAGEALLQAMESFIFAEVWEQAAEGRENVVLNRAVTYYLQRRLTEHLDEKLKTRISAVCRETRPALGPVLHA